MAVKCLYEMTEEQYLSLLESGMGILIYGDDFPPNINVFRTESTKYEATMQLHYVVSNIAEDSGASAENIIAFIEKYGEEIGALYADIQSGLITQQDLKDIAEGIDNE